MRQEKTSPGTAVNTQEPAKTWHRGDKVRLVPVNAPEQSMPFYVDFNGVGSILLENRLRSPLHCAVCLVKMPEGLFENSSGIQYRLEAA